MWLVLVLLTESTARYAHSMGVMVMDDAESWMTGNHTQQVVVVPVEVVGRYVGRSVFLGQIVSFHDSDQMSQGSQVSRVTR